MGCYVNSKIKKSFNYFSSVRNTALLGFRAICALAARTSGNLQPKNHSVRNARALPSGSTDRQPFRTANPRQVVRSGMVSLSFCTVLLFRMTSFCVPFLACVPHARYHPHCAAIASAMPW